jgi:hypothetical protein
MKLKVLDDKIEFKGGSIKAVYPVLEARKINELILVIYDHMEFPKDEPARNLFAYDCAGNELWRAEDIGAGATDAYTNFLSEVPLKVSNFSGFSVSINLELGRVTGKLFTK